MINANTIDAPGTVSIINSLQLRSFLILLKSLCSKTILISLECCLGIHIGGLIGLALGYLSGTMVFNHFKPLQFNDFQQMTQWNSIPQAFAHYGLIAGAFLGAVAIICLSRKITSRNSQADQTN